MLVNHLVNKGDRLSGVFAALADPTRRSIVTRLTSGDATVSELAAPYEMSLPAISKHLKVLEGAGLVSKTKRAQTRHCHLEAATLKEATDWLEGHRKLWEQNFANLDAYLQEIQKANRKKE